MLIKFNKLPPYNSERGGTVAIIIYADAPTNHHEGLPSSPLSTPGAQTHYEGIETHHKGIETHHQLVQSSHKTNKTPHQRVQTHYKHDKMSDKTLNWRHNLDKRERQLYKAPCIFNKPRHNVCKIFKKATKGQIKPTKGQTIVAKPLIMIAYLSSK